MSNPITELVERSRNEILIGPDANNTTIMSFVHCGTTFTVEASYEEVKAVIDAVKWPMFIGPSLKFLMFSKYNDCDKRIIPIDDLIEVASKHS